MKKNAKTITLITVFTTFALSVYSLNSPVTAAAYAFILWVISPYGYLLMLINLMSCKPAIKAIFITTLATCFYGLAALVDALFIHPDAQGGLVFVVSPTWQWAVLIAISLPLVVLNKIKNS